MSTSALPSGPMIDAAHTAKRLGIAVQTLAQHRMKGDGPPFYRVVGKIVYNAIEVDQWLAEQRHTSTAA